MAEHGSLRGKITGHVEVEPAMDLGGQGKDFGSHGSTSCKNPRLVAHSANESGLRLINGVELYIAHRADRFQYLSVNIL